MVTMGSSNRRARKKRGENRASNVDKGEIDEQA